MQCDILKHFGKKKKPEKLNEPLDSPLQVQLIKFLGLKNYFVDKFVFRRKQSSTVWLTQSTRSPDITTKAAS